MRIFVAALCGFLSAAASAGVPIRMQVETSRADVQEIPAYHGETLDFDVAFKSYGEPLAIPTNSEAQIFWQTNGMSAFFWRTNSVTIFATNHMATSFTPEMDPGVGSVFGFIGIPEQNYRASFVLRFKNSPGANPKEIEWPYRELDFAKIVVVNPPYYLKDETDAKIAQATQPIASVAASARQLALSAVSTAEVARAKADASADLSVRALSVAETVEIGKRGLDDFGVYGGDTGTLYRVALPALANPTFAGQPERESTGTGIHRKYRLAWEDVGGGVWTSTWESAHIGTRYDLFLGEERMVIDRLPAREVVDALATTGFVERVVATNFLGYRVAESSLVPRWADNAVRASSLLGTGGEQRSAQQVFDLIDGKVSLSFIATNNPAFCEIVRGVPPDPDLPWGEYGSLGAAVAALFTLLATRYYTKAEADAKIVAAVGSIEDALEEV